MISTEMKESGDVCRQGKRIAFLWRLQLTSSISKKQKTSLTCRERDYLPHNMLHTMIHGQAFRFITRNSNLNKMSL
jgi:hypothetical protein